ncbi:hypothetical protein [Pseudomonas sp.]|uniref:hypothetical protein n=1 Tax=Pseudomonas sp. TaxID=306 RepID=UPI0029146B9A|nr:hypothetical protein [Pseudomonas sp.]MDU4254409.1 hypothetical protein [Pseudomonas sp.]
MSIIRSALVLLLVCCDRFRSGWYIMEASEGRFFVRYRDGARSRPFHYANAKAYAKIFSGRVVHRATGHELRRWI